MKYELMLILSPKLTDKEIEKTLKEVKQSITDNGGRIFAEDVWGKRDLAYKISGHSSGYYLVMNFEGNEAGIPEIQKDLRIQPGILRNLLTKLPDGYKLEKFDDSTERTPRKLQTRQAEELSKKVAIRNKTGKNTRIAEDKKPVAVAAVETKEEKETKGAALDEKLKAIINDTDIDL